MQFFDLRPPYVPTVPFQPYKLPNLLFCLKEDHFLNKLCGVCEGSTKMHIYLIMFNLFE